MTVLLTFLWNYKAWVLAAVIAASSLAYISYIKIDHNLMAAKVVDQKSQIEALARNNQILEQNAAAIKKQDVQLKKIAQSSAQVIRMVEKLPTETKEVLQDANVTLVNDCLVDFANSPDGMLPDSCGAVKAYLPAGPAPSPIEGGRKPS